MKKRVEKLCHENNYNFATALITLTEQQEKNSGLVRDLNPGPLAP